MAAPNPVASTSRPLHVVFCLDNLNIGGTELNAVRTAELLARAGHRVDLIVMADEGPLLERFRAVCGRVWTLPMSGFGRPAPLRFARRVAKLLRAERPDVVHTHDMYSNAFVVPAARWARVPRVIASRRWWQSPARSHRMANRVATRAAHAVLANSPAVARLVTESDGVPAGRVHVVPNFVDEAAFTRPDTATLARWREELDVPPGALLVGCVANLLEVKDHRTLLEGFAMLGEHAPEGWLEDEARDIRLVLVGDGPCRAGLEAHAEALSIRERIRFAGRRPSQPSLHHLFAVSTLTSVSEGLPNTLIEALAAGVPVVATDVGAVRDAITPEVGRVVQPHDPASVRSALAELLRDDTLRKRMGTAARARARALYSPQAALKALLSLYGLPVRANRSAALE